MYVLISSDHLRTWLYTYLIFPILSTSLTHFYLSTLMKLYERIFLILFIRTIWFFHNFHPQISCFHPSFSEDHKDLVVIKNRINTQFKLYSYVTIYYLFSFYHSIINSSPDSVIIISYILLNPSSQKIYTISKICKKIQIIS